MAVWGKSVIGRTVTWLAFQRPNGISVTDENATLRESADQPASFWRRLERLSNSWTFDILVRVVYVGWFAFVLSRLLAGLDVYVEAHRSSADILFYTTVVSRVAVAVFLGTLIVLVVIRRRPVRKSRGFQPRLAAFFGTFILMSFPFFAASEMTLAGLMISTMLVLVGNGLSIYAALALGRSVSIMPEARKLVTSGAYGFIRHPLYVAEEIAIVGTFLLFAAPGALVLLIAHGYLQIRRMAYEEEVLIEAFPEYGDYARRTARAIPGIY